MTTVLVVDDNPMDRLLAGGFVEQAGMTPTYANDGIEALKSLEKDSVDIILTDLDMPECDGLELVRRVKTIDPTLPVILMTAKGSESIASEALTTGASSYVPKRDLAQQLQAVLDVVVEAAVSRRRRREVHPFITRTESQFELENKDRGATAALVSYFQDVLRIGDICDEGELVRIGTALSEAMVNAIDHGNLELDSKMREDEDNPNAYTDEAARRLEMPPYNERRVFVTSNVTKTEAVFTVRDEGPGFDPSSLPDPEDPENLMRPHGRGLMLIRTFLDQVSFNETGNEITMFKYARARS